MRLLSILTVALVLTFSLYKSRVRAQVITTTFQATEDAYVYESNPTTNYGNSTSIGVDGSPLKRSYLRFAVSGLTGTVTNATLRVYANSAQGVGYQVHALSDNTWTESAINYNNAPAYDPAVTGVSGPTTAATWSSVDVTSLISGDGTVNLVLSTTSVTNLSLASSESANPPELVIEVETAPPSPSPSVSPTPTPESVTIAATGDMVCGATSTGASCKQMQVSDLILGMNADAFLPLGDVQYENGELSDFMTYYDPSYGRLNNITRPAIGNHEYNDPSAVDPTQVGYWDYFNGAGNPNGIAGDRSKGYYSFDLGNWHLVALNTNCSKIGGCGSSSPQGQWLSADLAANTKPCTLAYAHHPLFSSGGRASTSVKPLWQIMQNYGTDVFLTGHDHTYERFAYQNSDGVADLSGIREFVVGTGGRNHTHLEALVPNSEIFDDTSYGALKMTLTNGGYDWEFVPIPGDNFTDTGSGTCHNAVAPSPSPTPTPTPTPSPSPTPTPTPTPTPQTLTFQAVEDAYVYQSSPSLNFGNSVALGVDASPVKNSYLKFDLTGLTGTVTNATLRVYGTSSLTTGYQVRGVTDNSWTETGITYGNAPSFSSTVTALSTTIKANTWVTADVTPLVTGNGTLSIVLTGTNPTNGGLASRQSANPPELIVETQ